MVPEKTLIKATPTKLTKRERIEFLIEQLPVLDQEVFHDDQRVSYIYPSNWTANDDDDEPSPVDEFLLLACCLQVIFIAFLGYLYCLGVIRILL